MNRKQLLKKIGVLSALPMPDKKALLAGVRARAGLPDGAAPTAVPPAEPPPPRPPQHKLIPDRL